jgi:hypothetical protein
LPAATISAGEEKRAPAKRSERWQREASAGREKREPAKRTG